MCSPAWHVPNRTEETLHPLPAAASAQLSSFPPSAAASNPTQRKLGFFFRSLLAETSQDEPQPGDPGEAAARGGGARGHGGAQDRRGLPGLHDRVRGQLELPDREHHLHRQGREGVAAGARVHQGEQGQVHDHPRHAQERPHVQAPRGQDQGQGVGHRRRPRPCGRDARSGCWWPWRWSSRWRRTRRCAAREEVDLSSTAPCEPCCYRQTPAFATRKLP